MIRSEVLIVGCILVVLGGVLLIVGYDKLQPTTLDNAVSFIEQVSGDRAPAALHPPRTTGYVLIGLGSASFVVGLGFILSCRSRRSP